VIDNIDELFDFTILLQPTSPLRTYKHIDESLELLISKNADAIISVCETEHSPLWSNTLPDDGNMQNFMRNEILHMKSQDMPKYYRLNGAIYICKTEKLINNKTLFIPDNIFSYIMDRKDSIDIDYEIDLQYAEFIFNHNQ
jgi:CMP-N-acetylneuraminic acid synthetase